MSFTVTATGAGASGQGGLYLQVEVLTGALEAGGASDGSTATSNVRIGGTLTPAFTHSLPVFSLTGDALTGVFGAAAAGNTYYQNANNSADNWTWACGYYSGTVTAATPLTYGVAATSGEDHANWCAYEIPPAVAGVTPAVDASTPALASTTAHTLAVTTAAFTPPGSCVLVALAALGGTGLGAGTTMAITDTSGLGLTWTQRAVSSSADNFQPTYIFTATIGGGTDTPPAYAATATDLGGGSGTWSNPANAEALDASYAVWTAP